MPFVTMTTITPLSSQWTHQMIYSEAAILTNTLDNENIQLDNIRNHINLNISYLATLLNLASSPSYGIWMAGSPGFETPLHPTGLEYIDLSIAVNGNFVPYTQLSSIQRVNIANSVNTVAGGVVINCIKRDLSELMQLNNNQNVQNRYSVNWTVHGSDLLFNVGNQITTPNTVGARDQTLIGQSIVCLAYRNPLLDNLIAPNTIVNNNYYGMIDLPDMYALLLIKMTQKNILEQIREQIPGELNNEINTGLQQITQNLQLDLQFEAAEAEKRKYGSPQEQPLGGAPRG